jgi:DNA-binding transcriptional ArsR family regulator
VAAGSGPRGRLTVMPIAITGLGEAGPGRPVPAVSALIEFGSALHALRDPGHHGATAWAAGVRAKMSQPLVTWTRAWWWTSQAIRAAPFVTAALPAGDFEGSLGQLRAMPASRLAGQLLRPVSRSGDTRAALHWSRSREPAVAAVVEALVLRPEEAVADFVAFLDRSWQEWFCAEWATIRPVLASRARVFADVISAHGAAAALATVDPSVAVTAPGSVSIAKVQNARHDVSRRGLLVASSSLMRPHLYVADVPRHPLLLIHPAEPGSPVPPAADLLRRLGTLAHRGRLEVARAIATEPRTAGEISALWHIDPTLVNRHLRALAAAGLARPARRGRFVQYQLDAGAIEALGTDLLALLLR